MDPAINIVCTESATASSFEVSNTLDTPRKGSGISADWGSYRQIF
jgi:hypothetical protein